MQLFTSFRRFCIFFFHSSSLARSYAHTCATGQADAVTRAHTRPTRIPRWLLRVYGNGEFEAFHSLDHIKWILFQVRNIPQIAVLSERINSIQVFTAN